MRLSRSGAYHTTCDSSVHSIYNVLLWQVMCTIMSTLYDRKGRLAVFIENAESKQYTLSHELHKRFLYHSYTDKAVISLKVMKIALILLPVLWMLVGDSIGFSATGIS